MDWSSYKPVEEIVAQEDENVNPKVDSSKRSDDIDTSGDLAPNPSRWNSQRRDDNNFIDLDPIEEDDDDFDKDLLPQGTIKPEASGSAINVKQRGDDDEARKKTSYSSPRYSESKPNQDEEEEDDDGDIDLVPVGVVTHVLIESKKEQQALDVGSILCLTETKAPLGRVEYIYEGAVGRRYLVRLDSPSKLRFGTHVSLLDSSSESDHHREKKARKSMTSGDGSTPQVTEPILGAQGTTFFNRPPLHPTAQVMRSSRQNLTSQMSTEPSFDPRYYYPFAPQNLNQQMNPQRQSQGFNARPRPPSSRGRSRGGPN